MNHLTQIMGLGTPGELRSGPDGRVYGWVEGLDAVGRRKGAWTPYSRLRRRVYRLCAYTFPRHYGRGKRPLIRPAAPSTQIRPLYTRNVRPAVTSMPRVLRPDAVALRGLGAPAEVQGLLGVGYPGAIVQGPGGHLYGWISGYDGLGNGLGFWSKLKRLAKRGLKFVAKNVAPKLLPIATKLLPFIPGVGPAAATAINVARGAGLLGIAQTGTPIYLGLDGYIYGVEGADPMHGLAADSMHGLAADPIHGLDVDLIHGLEADLIHGLEADPIHGFGADPIHGLEADPMHGFGADPIHGLEADPMHGFGADPIHGLEVDPMHGFGADPIHGLEADPMHGFGADPIHGLEADPMHGFGAEPMHGLEADLVHGFGADPMHGLEADQVHGLEADPIHGLEADPMYGLESEPVHGLEADPMYGLEAESVHGLEGYVIRKNGLLGYEPTRPSTTPMFRTPVTTPDIWKPHW
ncbi:hypothetical protein [Brevibacillus dissolubilis]|uniref:hypothetical protein n=1 Tax=Brevibacillus dissolubilis TaxID=1844116 RepID=UPI00210052ED|nr:hypothetical protein [Brevibacillus dissolubilis]